MPLNKFDSLFPFVTESLRNSRKEKRLAHAYLVHSDDDALREEFSTALAQFLSCSNPLDGDACGRCENCVRVEKNTHPELHKLVPTSKSREIPIGKTQDEPDTMRWFQSLFYFKSAVAGECKIGIISDADCMNTSSQNSFLKTLEEPPASCFFILATANPLALLPTIRSRCQNLIILKNKCAYRFDGKEDLLKILHRLQFSGKRDISLAEECASGIISISESLHGKAEQFLEEKWDKIFKESQYLDKSLMKKLEDRHKAEIESEYRRYRAYFLSLIHTWFAQTCLLSAGIRSEILANPELFEGFKLDVCAGNESFFNFCLKRAEELLQNLEWNVDEKLALRAFCMSLVFPSEQL